MDKLGGSVLFDLELSPFLKARLLRGESFYFKGSFASHIMQYGTYTLVLIFTFIIEQKVQMRKSIPTRQTNLKITLLIHTICITFMCVN